MPYISPEKHAELKEAVAAVLAVHVMARGRITEHLATILRMVDAAPADRQAARIRLEDFRNIVGILRSIDLAQMQQIPLFLGARDVDPRNDLAAAQAWGAWRSYRTNPVSFLLTCDEGIQRMIWSLVEQRLAPLVPTPEAKSTAPEGSPT